MRDTCKLSGYWTSQVQMLLQQALWRFARASRASLSESRF